MSLPGSELPSRDHQRILIPNSGPKIPPQLKILFPKQSAVDKDVSSSAIKDSQFPCSSQGFTFPDNSQNSIPGFSYPQQDSSPAYIHIHLHSHHKH